MESNDSSFSCPYYQFSRAEIWITSVAYIIIIIASLVGNCLIMWVIYLNKQKKTVSHYFIINMAVADLLITVFGMPVGAMEQIRNTDAIDIEGVGGEIFCKMLEYTKDVSISCSILSLVAIATDRFCAILIPFNRLFTLTKAKVIMVLIWITSLVLSIPLLLVLKVFEDENSKYCVEDWTVFDEMETKIERVYTIVLFVVLYAAPLSIIIILYGAIIRKVWTRTIPGQPTATGRQFQNKTKKNVLKMFMSVVLCFMICWLPYHVVFFVYSSDCPAPVNIWFFARFMGHANSSITPYIYFIFGRDYRKAVQRIFRNRSRALSPRFPLSYNRTVSIGQSERHALKPQIILLKSYTNAMVT